MLLRYMGSWWTVSLIALVLSGAYVLFTFSETPYERWLGFIFQSLPGMVLYYGLIVTLILASVRAIIRKLRPDGPTARSIAGMDANAELDTVEAVDGILRKGGFPTAGLSAEGLRRGLCLRKGRYSFLPGTVMRTGMVVFLIALSLSVNIRESEELVLSEGGEVELMGRKISLDSVKVGLEENYLRLGGKGTFRVDNISAVVRSGDRTFAVKGGKPARYGGRYYSITHFGYHQPVRIEGVSVEADMDVLPPGMAHLVEIPEGIGPVSFVLEPERIVKKGLLTGKMYNLKRPRYRLKFQAEGGKGGVAGLDEEADVDGHRVLLGSPSLYVKLRSTCDPSVPWLYTGLVLALVGAALMALRLFWYEKQFCIIQAKGKLLVGYGEEFYGKWGIMKFRKWMEQPPAEDREAGADK